MAWPKTLLMLKNAFGTDVKSYNNVLSHLYVTPKTHYGGEMHLGYKLANKNKRKYLKKEQENPAKHLKTKNLFNYSILI